MDIDAEELKKCARVSQPQTKRAETPTPTAGDNRAPEVKKPRNNKTPPPHVKVKALFIQRHIDREHNDTDMAELYEVAPETHPTLKELIEGDEDDLQGIMEQPDDTNKTARQRSNSWRAER